MRPGEDFHIPISSLTEAELLKILPESMRQSALQCDIVTKAFDLLKTSQVQPRGAVPVSRHHFTIDDLIDKIPEVASSFTAKEGDLQRAIEVTQRRTNSLRYHKIFGNAVRDWSSLLYPCLCISCKHLDSNRLQSVATAVLRELQDLRLASKIPPYVAVIDEAHLFVPEGEDSPCRQIIREGVRIGRHHGICIILMTQSPVDIDKRTIRQCNTRLVFALEPDQLDAIRGVRADASEEMLRALPKMPRGTCILSGTYESVKHAIPVTIRERRTPNSEGGNAPDIFAEMQERWAPTIQRSERR